MTWRLRKFNILAWSCRNLSEKNKFDHVPKQRMAGFLEEVRSVRIQERNQEQSSLLTAVKSTQPGRETDAFPEQPDSRTALGPAQKDAKKTFKVSSSSPEEALHILRSQPDLDELVHTLKQLHSHAFQPNFNVHAPGPLQAQITNNLLTTVVPNFWPVLKDKHSRLLTGCLTNVAGFNAVVSRLRLLGSRLGPLSQKHGNSNEVAVEDLLDVAKNLFSGGFVLSQLWQNLQTSVLDDVRRSMSWKEIVNLVASGKVIAAVAQAEDAAQSAGNVHAKTNRLANGAEYSAWIGRNISHMICPQKVAGEVSVENAQVATAQVFAKALNLGYSNSLLEGLCSVLIPLLVSQEVEEKTATGMLEHLPPHAKRLLLEQLLRWLSSGEISSKDVSTPNMRDRPKDVGALASLISLVVSTDSTLELALLSFLADPPQSSVLSISVRRASLATVYALTDASDSVHNLLEKLMTTFSDQLFISRAPALQQESLAQTLLLAAGYVNRKSPMALLMTARSSNYMRGVSNRLDSSNFRARWLGMVVATAVSKLVDKDGSQMNFGTDDVQTEEARWYIGLVEIDDTVGTLKEFEALLRAQQQTTKTPKQHFSRTQLEEMPKVNGKPVFGPPRPPAQTEVIGEKVTELVDNESEDDDNDLKPYAKPDSDPEDSDEDATLVNRNKVRAPVYIRDLMSMLRDDKSHDRFQLGIKHAASLIRRKKNSGREVKDHAVEIASILCSLQDPLSTDDYDELRLQAMIAVLLSDVITMGPWFSRQAFVGEYSIAQRCVMLSALGLGGRELAGFKDEDGLNPSLSKTDFPSKRLPTHLHSLYSPANSEFSTSRLNAASKDVELALIKPLALQAADQSTAHLNAVKVRTFSSRMEVERTKRKPAQNSLAKVFGAAFFFPLITHYQREISAYGSSSVYASVPFLLVTFIKTLSLLLHASGPATASMTEVISEFWGMMLSFRVKAVGDISVLQSVLFALLTLLEVSTEKRRIAQDHPKQLMETQQWVDMIFERMGMGGSQIVSEDGNQDEEKVRTLAAGILVKTREIIEAYQTELVGYSFE